MVISASPITRDAAFRGQEGGAHGGGQFLDRCRTIGQKELSLATFESLTCLFVKAQIVRIATAYELGIGLARLQFLLGLVERPAEGERRAGPADGREVRRPAMSSTSPTMKTSCRRLEASSTNAAVISILPSSWGGAPAPIM